ncbi:hypothetical protein ACLKA7_015657 [Drosophila subpalustris]
MGKLLHWKETRTPTINPIVYKCTPNFAPRNMMNQSNRAQTQKNFACTRRKLQHILKRHEKIEAIIQDVQHRLEPIHFLLAVADEKNSLDIDEEDHLKMERLARNSILEQDIFDIPVSMALGHLISPYSELKRLRVNQLENLEKQPKDTINHLPNDDWKQILKDLNDWCMEIDPTDTLESISIDTPAAVELDTLDIPTSNFNY